MQPDPVPPDDPVPLTPAVDGEVDSPVFTPAEYDPLGASNLIPACRPAAAYRNRPRLRMWLTIGGVLWALGLAGWFLLFVQGCESDSPTDPPAKKRK